MMLEKVDAEQDSKVCHYNPKFSCQRGQGTPNPLLHMGTLASFFFSFLVPFVAVLPHLQAAES